MSAPTTDSMFDRFRPALFQGLKPTRKNTGLTGEQRSKVYAYYDHLMNLALSDDTIRTPVRFMKKLKLFIASMKKNIDNKNKLTWIVRVSDRKKILQYFKEHGIYDDMDLYNDRSFHITTTDKLNKRWPVFRLWVYIVYDDDLKMSDNIKNINDALVYDVPIKRKPPCNSKRALQQQQMQQQAQDDYLMDDDDWSDDDDTDEPPQQHLNFDSDFD